MSKKYRNPPIVEALCEFRFNPSDEWDLTVPGLVYEKIRDNFPKRRQAKAYELNTVIGPEGVEQRTVTTDRMQFLHEDEKALIQVDRHLLAVNRLKPYSGWDEFLPLIRQGSSAYIEEAKPKGIQRIGLRYINRIEIPGQDVRLEDYLEFRPFVGSGLSQGHKSFIVGIQIPYESSKDTLRLQLANVATGTHAASIAMILDLDYSLAQPDSVSLDNVFEWMEVAHNHVEEAFEACISERLRQLFEEAVEE